MKIQLYILFDILIALLLSGLIGIERGQKNKPAGMRTHMIVGSVAALLISISKILANSFENGALENAVRTDPIRTIEAIIVGVSFIGGGTILKMPNESKVENLSTAASLLISAGIGISVALHQYIIAVGVTLILLLINLGLTRLEVILYKGKFKSEVNQNAEANSDKKSG